MATVEAIAPLIAPVRHQHGGAFYEFHRHGPEFQAGNRFSGLPHPKRAKRNAPKTPVHVPDEEHGDFDVYA